MSSRRKPPGPRNPDRAAVLKRGTGPTAPIGDEGLSHRLTLMLNRIVSLLVDGSAGQFRALGLSIPATRVMIGLYEFGDDVTVGTLAEMTSIDLSTTSHILRRLERQGMVNRQRDALDNRVVYAMLTQAGRVVAAQCREASLRHEEVLLGDISDQDEALLKRLLVRVYDNAKNGFGS